MASSHDNTPLLRLERAGRTFRMGEVEVQALADVNLDIRPGELLVILGPSGSGKSTLLNLIGGLDRPTRGRVWYRDDDLTAMSDAQLTDYRRERVGFIFQFYNLMPTLTAYENVQVATELARDPLDPATALAMVGLSERAEHFPAQLSGGEQQRVSVARALAKRPELLLADEPTGALDITAARNVLSLLQQLNREQGLTTIIITHNPAIAAIANRTIRLASGHMAEIHENETPVAADEIEW
ncbi:MAG TPA: ABC transporter ATP-binding protein [Phycisphaerae bacterium]|nr:ABC transporter ATP-binding protein [Phycisphaerae bacterium]HOJ72316.1 ABC transporter ATP-binding protein [Phycisphaerae bacterium]HOM50022.1 ABC transporter ATP-binding protein [Phycisphaerae bacterium]HON65333.1 ABC transporter ATP-binding protein [Phycisphaerae bacterium]HOQ84730.1 ABC transporter ATP-binding protein [Phycisphaerae bacterium]